MNADPAPHDEIARLAYKIYEEEGRPEGHAEEHWCRAIRLLREQRVPLPDPHNEAGGHPQPPG